MDDNNSNEASDEKLQSKEVNQQGDTLMEEDEYHSPENEEEELNKTPFGASNKIKPPKMNVQERIIICLDVCADSNGSPFRFGDGTKQMPLSMLKRVVQMFMFCKMTVDTKHQYALMVLHEEGASWVVDFTDSPGNITNVLATLKTRQQPPECDLSAMFDAISSQITMPHVADMNTELPPYIYRVILLYARTNCRPLVGQNCGAAKALMKSPYFFLDLIYVHELLNEEVKDTCQSIFNDLCSELCLPTSYVFNVGRNPTKLHDCMARLIAHPLQRPKQEDAEYKLLPAE